MRLRYLPVKQAGKTDVAGPLRSYLVKHFGAQVTGSFADVIQRYQSLRDSFASIPVSVKDLLQTPQITNALYEYGAACVYLRAHFPLKDSATLKVKWAWQESFVKKPRILVANDIDYEFACVLYNLAAIYSTMAAAEPLDSAESCVLACKNFVLAAGILNYIANDMLSRVLPSAGQLSLDLCKESCLMYRQWMLANAQFAAFRKAQFGKLKAPILAKLLAGSAQLFDSASKMARSALLSSFFDKSTIATLSIGRDFSLGLAHSLLAHPDLVDITNFGVTLGRLQVACDYLTSATAQEANVSRIEIEPVIVLCSEMRSRLQEALHDNAKVYHSPVPSKAELDNFEAKILVQVSACPDVVAVSQTTDPFGSLVPVEVRNVTWELLGRLDALAVSLQKCDKERQDATKLALSTLPLQSSTDTSPIPDALWSQVVEVRDAMGGLDRLNELKLLIPQMRQECNAVLTDVHSQLTAEEDEDSLCKEQFGVRWTRPSSLLVTKDMRDQLSHLRNKLKEAEISDKNVLDESDRCLPVMQKYIAVASKEDLASMVGASVAERAPQNGHFSAVAKPLLERLDAILNSRVAILQKISPLRDTASTEFPLTVLVPAQRDGIQRLRALAEEWFNSHCSPLSQDVAALNKEENDVVAELNRQYADWNKSSGAVTLKELLSSIQSAVSSARTVLKHLDEGMEFYVSIQDAGRALQKRAQDFAAARRMEKDDHVRTITAAGSTPVTAPAAAFANSPQMYYAQPYGSQTSMYGQGSSSYNPYLHQSSFSGQPSFAPYGSAPRR